MLCCVQDPSTLIPTAAQSQLPLITATNWRVHRTTSRFTAALSTLIDLAGHAAVAVKIGKMAPTIDLRIDYLRPSIGESIVARARLLKVGRLLARVDVDVTDAQGRLIAVGRGSFSTALEPPTG
jgi:uncharacterized protein (TIGR00369 family)